MVTEEQVQQTFEKIEKMREDFNKRMLNENAQNFKTIEEIIEYYQAEPLDEFEKKFMNGN